MAKILRGEVYWANLDPTKGHEQSGQRPVLVLSQDIFNERSGVVIAVALTSQLQVFLSHFLFPALRSQKNHGLR